MNVVMMGRPAFEILVNAGNWHAKKPEKMIPNLSGLCNIFRGLRRCIAYITAMVCDKAGRRSRAKKIKIEQPRVPFHPETSIDKASETENIGSEIGGQAMPG